jgi:predicted nuclease with RNAse H fold
MNVGQQTAQTTKLAALGLHLMPLVSGQDDRRPSVLACLDDDGRLTRLERLGSNEQIATAVGHGPGLVCVDQPLVVRNMQGQRAFEHLLSWCDAPTLPISITRSGSLYGGLRGLDIATSLVASEVTLAESLPDLTLRQLIWEHENPLPIDLEAYRARWLGLRAPRYRPKGVGRARPSGLAPAWEVLSRVADLNGWEPPVAPDDWEAIATAAELDAIVCAYAAWRALHVNGGHRALRFADGVLAVLATDQNLAERLEIHAERLGGIIVGTLLPADDTPHTPA